MKTLLVNSLPLSSIFTVLAKTRGLFLLLILKLCWFKKAFISVPIISRFFSSIYIWEKLYELSLESITLIFPVDVKNFSS